MAADSGLLTILILLDLSAALDTISHSILLNILSSINIMHTPMDWIPLRPTQIIQISFPLLHR